MDELNENAPLFYAIKNDDGTYGDLHEFKGSVELHADIPDDEIERYANAIVSLSNSGSFGVELDKKNYRIWEWIFGIKPKPNVREYYVYANRMWRKGHPRCRMKP